MATTISSATRPSPDDCACVEPGCGFLAPPRALLDHLVTVHSLRAVTITYGPQYELIVPASERRLVLVAEDDKRVFVLTVGDGSRRHVETVAAVGAAQGRGPFVSSLERPERALKAVSVLCLRASAAVGPQYAAELSNEDGMVMGGSVSTSSGPFDSALKFMLPVNLHFASKDMYLRIRIRISISIKPFQE